MKFEDFYLFFNAIISITKIDKIFWNTPFESSFFAEQKDTGQSIGFRWKFWEKTVSKKVRFPLRHHHSRFLKNKGVLRLIDRWTVPNYTMLHFSIVRECAIRKIDLDLLVFFYYSGESLRYVNWTCTSFCAENLNILNFNFSDSLFSMEKFCLSQFYTPKNSPIFFEQVTSFYLIYFIRN